MLRNRLTGSVPKEIGNITTLKELVLESNHLSGSLPSTLGNLSNLERLLLASNNFTGELPTSFGMLTSLTNLVIQASGLSGPIPSEIGLLKKLTDLRISYLNGASSPFPSLNNLTDMKYLELRNCKITGKLPDYLAEMTSLKLLDLSFNKISGQIPPKFHSLAQVDRMNFFASSSLDNNSKVVSCLGNHPCEQVKYHLYINCGGKEETIDGVTFEGDEDTGKGSLFFLSKTNWAFSNTGNYLDDDRETDDYVTFNTYSLSMKNSKLYETARLTPLSLTYYAYCMGNANYTIGLHFAEIMFTNDTSFSSLGRRIFYVYLQGRRVLKDFNIVDAAGGVGKAFIKTIPVTVTSGTLEIRFYWAGKGTTNIPTRGVYGPLISAISVYSDSEPPSEGQNTLPAGAIVGISAAVVLFIILALGTLWWRGCLGRKSKHPHVLEGLNMQVGSFTLKQILTATNNFDTSNKLGEGGFGSVYKGILLDGTKIAVKQLSSKSKQGKREFVNEMGMISSLQHSYLVKLYGFCTEGDQLLLVYEYMENNSLARALFVSYFCSGYMAPEYATRGHLTDKADVYSFDIVALEIVCGRSNTIYRSKDKCLYLLDWALVVKETGNLMELVDPRLGSNFDQGEAMAMINIALLCTNVSPSARPAMSSVVSMLEGKAAVEELVANPNDLREEINAMWTLMQQNHKIFDNDNRTESASSVDVPCTSSSTS